MKTVEFTINVHCEQCIQKIKPLLDVASNVHHWEIKLKSNILSIQSEAVTAAHINALLDGSGYYVTQGQPFFWGEGRVWKKAIFNTLNCLLGCSIGDFGMVIFLQAYYPKTALYVQMLLAIVAGLITSVLLETILLRVNEKFRWYEALKVALGMSFLSMVAMEIAMTGTDFMLTGGMAAFDSLTYWLALLPALVVGFLVPLPYNYYKLKKYNRSCHN